MEREYSMNAFDRVSNEYVDHPGSTVQQHNEASVLFPLARTSDSCPREWNRHVVYS